MFELRSFLIREWGQFANAVGEAVGSLRAHKLRSFLTLLGVVIGVAAVVFVSAAINGLGLYAIETSARTFGAESFLAAQVGSAGQLGRREYLDKLTRNKPIRLEDVRFVKERNGDRVLYSPYSQRFGEVRRDGFTSEDTTVIGADAAMAAIRDIEIVEGRFFTEQEELTRSNVAVIGETVRNTLFPENTSPIGRVFRIQGIEFRIVGRPQSLGSAFGRDQDQVVYIPYRAFVRLYGSGRGIQLFGRARESSGLSMEDAIDETRVALRTRFGLKPNQADVFDIVTPEASRAFIDRILGLVTAVAVPVTGIALVVASVVIMNVMLVSVSERTREIGLRKSVGARNVDIMLQVLTEAFFLSTLGGAAGVAIGGGFSWLLGSALGFEVPITAEYVLVGLSVSMLVGIVAGWYPAQRASRLDPIDALRME